MNKKRQSFIIFGLVIAIGLFLTNQQEQTQTQTTPSNKIVDVIIVDQAKHDQAQKEKAEALANRDPIIVDIERAVNNPDITVETVLKSSQINTNVGKNDGSKIILIYLQWNRLNSAEQTKRMLSMQSARLVNELSRHKNISEIVVFWEVPYHLKDQNIAKFNYSKKNNEWIIDNEWFSPVIK